MPEPTFDLDNHHRTCSTHLPDEHHDACQSIIMLSALAQLIHFNPWLLLSIRLVLGFGVVRILMRKQHVHT